MMAFGDLKESFFGGDSFVEFSFLICFLLLFLLFLASHCFSVVAPAFLDFSAFLCIFSYLSPRSLCAGFVLPGFSPLLSFFLSSYGVLIPYRNYFFFLWSLLLSLLVYKLVFNP